jgi:hypothetical protein
VHCNLQLEKTNKGKRPDKQLHEKGPRRSSKTLQPEHTRIGFNIFSKRLQISHDLRCPLEKSELGREKFSVEALVTATLERVSLARGIG